MGVSKVIDLFHMVATQLNTLTPVGTAITMVAYMKNSSPPSGMPTVNMWCAQTINDRNAIEQWRRPSTRTQTGLAAEGRQDLGNHAESRQDHDVDLGVTEEPEDMLEHHRVTATSGVEEAGVKEPISENHGGRTGQNRHYRDQQKGSDQPGPDKQRHFQQSPCPVRAC